MEAVVAPSDPHRATAAPLIAFVLLYTALYGAYGTESAYLPAFLQEHGLAYDRIGLVLAAGTVVRIVAGPVVGRLADRWQARRPVLAVAAAVSGLVNVVYSIAFGFGSLLGISMASAAATASLAPLADALSVAASTTGRGFPYGWVRGAGSAAFVAGTLLSGQLVGRFGVSCIVLSSSALFLVTAAAAWSVPAVDHTSRARRDETTVSAFRELWGIAAFRRLLGVAALVIGSHALNDGFAVITWQGAGYGSGTISLLWSESVAAEVFVFFVAGPWLLARLGPSGAAMLSAGAGVVRWTVLGSTTALGALVAVQLLHGFTFALLHLAAMGLIGRTIPDRLSATAQTIYGTFALGLASATLTAASGYLYRAFGLHSYWAMTLLCLIAVPMAATLKPSPQA